MTYSDLEIGMTGIDDHEDQFKIVYIGKENIAIEYEDGMILGFPHYAIIKWVEEDLF